MNVAFVVLVSAIVWGVLSRYVTRNPATWVEEVSSIAFTVVVFVGAAEVQRRGKHVRVDLLTSLLPPRARGGARRGDQPVRRALLFLRRLARLAADDRQQLGDDQHAQHSAERSLRRA